MSGITEVLGERELLLDDITEIIDEAFEVIRAEKNETLRKDRSITEAGEKIRTLATCINYTNSTAESEIFPNVHIM